jgi:hypothetical protein
MLGDDDETAWNGADVGFNGVEALQCTSCTDVTRTKEDEPN